MLPPKPAAAAACVFYGVILRLVLVKLFRLLLKPKYQISICCCCCCLCSFSGVMLRLVLVMLSLTIRRWWVTRPLLSGSWTRRCTTTWQHQVRTVHYLKFNHLYTLLYVCKMYHFIKEMYVYMATPGTNLCYNHIQPQHDMPLEPC